MLIIGLTGGIASGKSLVSGIFRDLGAVIIDADIISREVVRPGRPAYREILDVFGKDIVGADGEIIRKRLGKIVFSDKKKRKHLEEIIHPRIIEEQERRLAELSRNDPRSIAVIDAALLIEAGFHEKVDRLIVVSVERDIQLCRLIKRDGLDRNEAEKRVASQLPLKEKAAMADYVIDNNGTVEETRSQAIGIWKLNEKLETGNWKQQKPPPPWRGRIEVGGMEMINGRKWHKD